MDHVSANAPSLEQPPLTRGEALMRLSVTLVGIVTLVTLVVKACGFPLVTALSVGVFVGAVFVLYSAYELSPFVHSKVQACLLVVNRIWVHFFCMACIHRRVDLNKPRHALYGSLPLFSAAKVGNVATVKALLKAGASLETRDQNGRTALMWAAIYGQIDVMQELIQARASLEAFDHQGHTALIWAALIGQSSSVDVLHRAGAFLEADYGCGTALMLAAENGLQATLRGLLAAGAKLETQDKEGKTALMRASKGNVAGMQILLQAGAKLEARDNKQRTVLMVAACIGTPETITALVGAGAEIEAHNACCTALMSAAKAFKLSNMEALLRGGACADFYDEKGYTAFAYILGGARSDREEAEILERLRPYDVTGREIPYVPHFLERKWLANVWGVVDLFSTYDTIEFSLNGHINHYAMRKFSGYIAEFFGSRDLSAKILPGQVEEICRTFADSHLLSAKTTVQLLEQAHQGKPVFISGGYEKHLITILLYKDSFGRYQLMISNRGGGSRLQAYTTTIHLIPKEHLNQHCISKLSKNDYKNAAEFYAMLNTLHLLPFGGFNQKFQYAGNCTVAGFKAALYSLLVRSSNLQIANALYKEFTEGFMREKALKEHLDKIASPMEPLVADKALLKEIQRKYEKEKLRVVLSDAIVTQLQALL